MAIGFPKRPKSWKEIVHFTSRDKHVSLTQHFKVGSCERAAMGRLESMAKLNPQRCVFESFDVFVAGCNAAQRKKKMKEYSKSAYEAAISFFRDLGIIPHTKQGTRVKCLVNFQGCERAPAWREGWIVAPHDFLTHKHHGACHFVGFGSSPDFPFEHFKGPKLWTPHLGPSPYVRVYKTGIGPVWQLAEIKDEIKAEKQVETKVGLRCDQVAFKGGNQVDESSEPFETTEDRHVTVAEFPTESTASVESVSQLGMVGMGKAVGIENSVDHLSDEATIEPLPQTVLSSLGLLTDEDQNLRPSASREAAIAPIAETVSARPRPSAPTVKEFFEGAYDLVGTVTQGGLDRANPDWVNFKKHGELEAALHDAIKRCADLRVEDTKALSTVMGVTMDILNEWHSDRNQNDRSALWQAKNLLYPKCWLLTKGRLAKGLRLKKRAKTDAELWQQFNEDHPPGYDAMSLEEKSELWDAYRTEHQ